MYNIIIADDHPLFRDAIKAVILSKFPNCNLYDTYDLDSTLELISERMDIDLILLDLNMPGMDGFNGLIKIRNQNPEIPVAIVTAEEDKETVLQSITYGAVGYIAKSTNSKKIAEALANILQGKVYLPSDIIRGKMSKSTINTHDQDSSASIDPELVNGLTRRQLLVYERITLGQSNKQIAYDLHIAETTVKAHVSAILSKLGVQNRIQAALRSSHINFDKLLNRH